MVCARTVRKIDTPCARVVHTTPLRRARLYGFPYFHHCLRDPMVARQMSVKRFMREGLCNTLDGRA
ncbi:unnamed protein product, partial [Trichogramma brassicae]